MAKYNSEEIEKKWQEYWEKKGIYKFCKDSDKDIYSIDTPPPYASAGHLHVGHALHYTQFEIIARYKRMRGFNVYFPPCFDDNGLPTEKFVEKKLGINKKNTDRVEFRKICREESRKAIKDYSDEVFKALGHSYDWDLLYNTIGDEAQKVSQKSFLDLVKQGDCYRAEEPVIWCPYHGTALAQAEVIDLDRHTTLNYIDFDIEGNEERVTIATTRPELLPSCVGIFVNPEDNENSHLIGKKLKVPLFNYEVEVKSDENVDMEFGTGVLMVCTFGDNADIEKWKKYNLDLKVCIDEEGKLNELADKYEGLDVKEAKEKIIADLRGEGRLKKQEKLQQTVGSCERCDTPVEYIVTKQWFVKALDYKDELIKQGRKINWYPNYMRNRYEDWVNNLGWDWCVSRQRYYGVPIPVWYCKECDKPIFPSEDSLPIDPTQESLDKECECGSDDFEAEDSVFDTWMTSSVTPQIAGRWLENKENYDNVFPFSLRPQAQDIIRTWAFYTILKSYLHSKSIPWENIAIGTYVLDEKGHGMSKSKGNVVWADDLLERYDVDTFRYWVGNAKWGGDLPFKESELVAGKRFMKKLWNASKFVLMNLEDMEKIERPEKLELIDNWHLVKLNNLIEDVTKSFEEYETGDAKRKAERFFWDFTDNYLEIVKDRVYKGEGEKKKSAQYVLAKTLLAMLKMFSPIMPHITEEIYHKKFSEFEGKDSIHISNWPEKEKIDDETVEEKGNLFIEILKKVRHEKSSENKSVKAPINITIEKDSREKLEGMIEDLKNVTNAGDVKEGNFNIEFLNEEC